MKALQYSIGRLFIIAIACGFAASTTIQAGAFDSSSARPNDVALTDNARLIVRRAPDFGTLIYLNLFIDGVQVTTLGLNERYEAIVRPGRRVLSIGTSPSPYGKTKFTHRRVLVRRGGTYAFTAFWDGPDDVRLETWDAARHARVRW